MAMEDEGAVAEARSAIGRSDWRARHLDVPVDVNE